MTRVLFVLTAADTIGLTDGSQHPTGFWAEEFVVSHRAIIAAGYDVTVATPGGRPAPVDPVSVAPEAVGADTAAELTSYLSTVADVLQHPAVLAEQDATSFAAVVLPGGHGPMVDLAYDENLGRILRVADGAGTIIAPFCHGPAALLSAKRSDDTFQFVGRRMAAFTNEEEHAGGVQNMPWLLADRLAERGAVLDAGAAWSSHVVVDRNLISGQNPQSSGAVAAAVLIALHAE